MKQSRIMIAAAAAAVGVLFAAPTVTAATPFAPNGVQAVTTTAKEVTGIEPVAKRKYYRKRYHRGHRYYRGYRYGRPWRYRRGYGYYGYGAPFYFGFGYPYYGYPYGYYGYGPSIGFGFRIN
jgi:hypothetical protein